MNSVKTITIDNQVRPIALSRSSIKVIKDSENTVRKNQIPSEPHNHYTNVGFKQEDQEATRIEINTPNSVQEKGKQIKLVIANSNDSGNHLSQEDDSYLTALIDEYQALLNRKDCDNQNCYRFKLLSHRVSQTLFERITELKNEAQSSNNIGEASELPATRQTSLQQSCNSSLLTSLGENINMDRDSLLNLVIEKNRRIQDLERLVEEQRRLRMQDACQVEEKAARIKEWVANKLKELENQNKQLKDHNRRQKEAVESLSAKLATMSPISSPRKINSDIESVQFIDRSSPVETVDVEKSLRTRRPQAKKIHHNNSFFEDQNQNLRIKFDSDSYQDNGLGIQRAIENGGSRANIEGSSHVAGLKSIPSKFNGAYSRESPVYDSVAIEHTSKRVRNGSSVEELSNNDNDTFSQDKPSNDSKPPPPPPHQVDKWELKLYNLANQTFSSLIKRPSENNSIENYSQLDSIESSSNSERDATTSRKSSTSLRNDLISLVKPSFTTIDGDQVVDSFMPHSDLITGKSASDRNMQSEDPYSSMNHQNSNDQSSQSSIHLTNKFRKDSSDSCENIEKPLTPLTPNLFDSPMRSRAGKDSILRTQSVKRNPAPEQLHDFISADLVKRGYLVKPGALKNHTRWFVIKNFHLYSYKCEAEETAKATPGMKFRLDPSCQVTSVNQTGESSFPLKITCPDKSLQLIAETAQSREEWVRILTVTINMSDLEPDALSKNNSTYDGIVSVTRHGHTKRCYATLVNHVVFFLRSLIDPSPMSYMSVRGSRIREITDNYDYDIEEQEWLKQKSKSQDCSLAIYPKYSMTHDPVYITLGNQQETDKWFYFLSLASGLDQSNGTKFERTLTKLMVYNSLQTRQDVSSSLFFSENSSCCLWKEHSVMLYSDRPIPQPLTSLPNETFRMEAVELFKSILLFTQVPLEPVAIDYHVSLLQNCLGRFLKYPELRNEFYAQLIKQCTYVLHRCASQKSSSCSSGCSSITKRSSLNSLSPSSSECQFVTDVQLLDSIVAQKYAKADVTSTHSQLSSSKEKSEVAPEISSPPSQSELLQAIQMISLSVSLNLPRGRMRWWLIDYLKKFANQETNIGKYALYSLKAIERTIANGTRDNVPSRTEIMSILLKNPYDHSDPHSLPVNFSDGSYLVVGADGSTTVEEFMSTMGKSINIRHSQASDFYLFADDPSGSRDLHILEPQRKIFDIVGWWEQTLRRYNSGRYQSTKFIKLMCKKRLVLRTEDEETQQERLLIAHQVNQEVVSGRIPLTETLSLELGAVMAQLNFGDFDKSKDPKILKRVLDKVKMNHLPNSQTLDGNPALEAEVDAHLVSNWQQLLGRSVQDCVRVYLNCVRRLKTVVEAI